MIQHEAASLGNVALKHKYEISVQPFTGEKVKGDEHAPLLYSRPPQGPARRIAGACGKDHVGAG